jgi:hypothetical protein
MSFQAVVGPVAQTEQEQMMACSSPTAAVTASAPHPPQGADWVQQGWTIGWRGAGGVSLFQQAEGRRECRPGEPPDGPALPARETRN